MQSKIKILHVTYDMHIGGTEEVIYQLCKHTDEARFENSILCIEGAVGPIGNKLAHDGIDFHVLHRVPGFDTSLIKEIGNLIKSNDINVVHCHQYTPYVYGVLAAVFTKAKVVFTEHGRFHPDSYSWKRRMIYEWFRNNSIEVIYNGIEPKNPSFDASLREKLEIQKADLVFGTITRFDTIKNLPLMVKAFAELQKKHPSTRLLLVGDGDEKPQIEQLVAELKVTEHVIFTGFQTDTEKYMSLIDVYVLSSFSEGTSMTLLEAMAATKCCIVTKVGGNVEIIENHSNGLVIESDNIQQLTQAMKSVVKDASFRERLGAQASDTFATRFTQQIMINRYMAVYLRAAKLQE